MHDPLLFGSYVSFANRKNLIDAMNHVKTLKKIGKKEIMAVLKMSFKRDTACAPALMLTLAGTQLYAKLDAPTALYHLASSSFFGMIADKTYRKLWNHTFGYILDLPRQIAMHILECAPYHICVTRVEAMSKRLRTGT
ncbi:34318_t:CDS:1, partial [Racocetra persica]